MDIDGKNKVLSPDDFDAILKELDAKRESKPFNPPELPEQLVGKKEVTFEPQIPKFDIPKAKEEEKEEEVETIEVPDNIITYDFANISQNSVGDEIEEEKSHIIPLTEEQKKLIKKVKPYVKGGIAAVLVALGVFIASKEAHEYSYEKNFSSYSIAVSEGLRDADEERPHKLSNIKTFSDFEEDRTDLAGFGYSIAAQIEEEAALYSKMNKPYDVKQHLTLYLGVHYNRITDEIMVDKWQAYQHDYGFSHAGFMADIYHIASSKLNERYPDLKLPDTLPKYLSQELGLECNNERETEKALSVLGKTAGKYVHNVMNPVNKVEKEFEKLQEEEGKSR